MYAKSKQVASRAIRQLKVYCDLSWRRLLELGIELSLFVPLFFLPSLYNSRHSTVWWHLHLMERLTSLELGWIHFLWVVLLGGVLAVILLIRHRILLLLYLLLAGIRLIAFITPSRWEVLHPQFRYVLNHLLFYPFRPILMAFAIWVVIVILTGGAGLGAKVVHDYDYDGNETTYLVPKDRK